MRQTLLILLLVLALAPAGQAADPSASFNVGRAATTAADAAKDEGSELQYTINPRNVIQIRIFGEGTVNQIYRVDESGYITHALVGRIRLGGQTVAQAEKTMENALRGDYIINPRVTVFVLEHSRFSVLGEVRRPGTYEIQGRVSLIEALSMAGGFTPVASQGDVKIIHKNENGPETSETVDVARIARGERTQQNIYIRPDDVIVVAKSFF